MVIRARLSPPREERSDWPYHHAKWAAVSASVFMSGDRRMEAENYLASGYGLRLAMEARKDGWAPMARVAKVTQPNRLKGILVSPEFGTAYLAATQIFDLRPVPRKWLSLDRTDTPADRFVSNGMILVTRSGSVGRATLAHKPHENVLISDDLLRVAPRKPEWWGWLYAFLRSPQARAIMIAAQYGHIIKHLEVAHLDALPVPLLRDDLLPGFRKKAEIILDKRNHAQTILDEAYAHFEKAVGSLVIKDLGEKGFSISASEFFSGRRRMDGYFHNPLVRAIRAHFARQGRKTLGLKEAGFDIWLPTRFKRVAAEDGVELLDSSDLFEVNPDVTKRIADGGFGDPYQGRVRAGWLLLARSGQIYGINGSLVMATKAHEGKVVSDHIIRVAPTGRQLIPTGYVYVALSHPTIGRPLVKALAYGSSVPEIEVADLAVMEVVRLPDAEEEEIARLAERSSASFAQADILEIEIAAEAEVLVDSFLAGDRDKFMARWPE